MVVNLFERLGELWFGVDQELACCCCCICLPEIRDAILRNQGSYLYTVEWTRKKATAFATLERQTRVGTRISGVASYSPPVEMVRLSNWATRPRDS